MVQVCFAHHRREVNLPRQTLFLRSRQVTRRMRSSISGSISESVMGVTFFPRRPEAA